MVPEGAGTGALTRARDNRAQYDALAAAFDANDAFWSNPYDRATWDLENALVTRYLSGTGLLLDLGVGFYPHVESTAGRRVICVDVSDDSLRVARTAYHDRNPRMRYVCADALALPLPDQSVDAIVAGGELVNHVDAERLLAELYRVLAPSGRVVLSIAMKWCVDSLYCLLDAFLGVGIGYAMTRNEAMAFVRNPGASSDVTWAVTPDTRLRVTLYGRRHLRRLLAARGFRVHAMRSSNLVSGIVPLPVQQDPNANGLARWFTAMLLSIDRTIAGRIPGVQWAAGNVYLVLEKCRSPSPLDPPTLRTSRRTKMLLDRRKASACLASPSQLATDARAVSQSISHAARASAGGNGSMPRATGSRRTRGGRRAFTRTGP